MGVLNFGKSMSYKLEVEMAIATAKERFNE
jgi:hypothetical protein